ncbi:unnamed protein product [Dovyalis caffra]|uniref:malate dehydrogenase n=1 Tax=Dovyalis caffra TaxID=77055 RepID=A0AAV1SC37_9ROSI|nr:unnamed protein product [Dovyalis caffra]
MIARGVMLGPDQPVILHLLDIEPAAEALNGVKMELVDAAFPLLKGVIATTDPIEACMGVNIAVMVGGFPRKEGMERKDVMSKNVSIYKAQASALEKHAAEDCKVLVIANPANTNALILKEFAPSIPEKNITCLTRLDHNRALGQISERLDVQVSDVKNVIIWGNHSSTQYPDVNHATVKTSSGEKPVRELVSDDQWLNTEFITTVQQRGAAIIKARKLSSALSAASSACDHIRDWVLGTPKGTWVSMGVYSDGSYGIQPGLIYSFPVTCEKGKWSIVQGIKIDELSRAKMDATAKELMEEKSLAYSILVTGAQDSSQYWGYWPRSACNSALAWSICCESLKEVEMELIDAAFPLLQGILATTDVNEACKGVIIAVMVGGFPWKEGMERRDVVHRNVPHLQVVANPANINALILKEFAPSMPDKNITNAAVPKSLIELENDAEHLLLARNQVVENDKERNGNREALTALRKRAKTTKTSIKSPFEWIMKDTGRSGSRAAPLVKEICGICGNHDEKEKTWMMFPGSDVFACIPFHAAHTILEKDQELLEYEAKKLQSYVKDMSLLISEKGVLADRISPGVLRSLVTLTDKPK